MTRSAQDEHNSYSYGPRRCDRPPNLGRAQTGIARAFGPQLRRILGYALGNRSKAFLAGLGVTSILQSSTATGLMVTAFAAGGLVDLVPALAVMLGANVGTTLIVQVLSLMCFGFRSCLF